MKKVLIYENSDLLGEIITDLSQFKPLLENVKATFEKLELGNFTNETLKEITEININGIEKIFFQKQEDDCTKMGVANHLIKQNVLKGANELFNEFLIASNNLRKFRPITYSRLKALRPHQISFENNIFYVSSEDKEQILENDCRIYIQTEKEFELYNNINALIEAYNKVNSNLNELQFTYNFSQGKGLTAIQNVFLQFKNENSFEVAPGSISFAINQNENRLKFNS